MEAIESEGTIQRSYDIFNTDRATLGRVGGAIALRHGDQGFAGQVTIDLKVLSPCLQDQFLHIEADCVLHNKFLIDVLTCQDQPSYLGVLFSTDDLFQGPILFPQSILEYASGMLTD